MTAIFDIGKTNKKVLVFDDALRVIFEKNEKLKEAIDDDGFPCEDVEVLTSWVRQSLEEVIETNKFEINKLNFSAYGASFVHLDRSGKPVTPLYNYLKPFPDDLREQFYDDYGPPELIAQQTASPTLGFLNSGMQLYWLKHAKPELFKRIAVSLHLPQYLSTVFTGYYFSDITSIGCHTQLWDFEKHQYHAWVTAEKLESLLPPTLPSKKRLPVQLGGRTIECGIGLHDSSAALIPYQKRFSEPFVLLSTGTWSIALNPFNHEVLTPAELAQDCLCYLSYEGTPVKASRLFLGHEHEEAVEELAIHFHLPEASFSQMKFNPELMKKADPSPGRSTAYATAAEAYHALQLQLVNKQIHALNLVLTPDVRQLFVDGGFSQNDVFMNILAARLPGLDVYGASVPHASAGGAALVVEPALVERLEGQFVMKRY